MSEEDLWQEVVPQIENLEKNMNHAQNLTEEYDGLLEKVRIAEIAYEKVKEDYRLVEDE